MTSGTARRREEQGRLFWVWLLTLPVILMQAASLAFDAPWPDLLTQRAAMVVLAFPVLFIVGEPLWRDAAAAVGARRLTWSPLAAAAVLGSYASGALSLIVSTPPLAWLSPLVVSTYLSVRYLRGRY